MECSHRLGERQFCLISLIRFLLSISTSRLFPGGASGSGAWGVRGWGGWVGAVVGVGGWVVGWGGGIGIQTHSQKRNECRKTGQSQPGMGIVPNRDPDPAAKRK